MTGGPERSLTLDLEPLFTMPRAQAVERFFRDQHGWQRPPSLGRSADSRYWVEFPFAGRCLLYRKGRNGINRLPIERLSGSDEQKVRLAKLVHTGKTTSTRQRHERHAFQPYPAESLLRDFALTGESEREALFLLRLLFLALLQSRGDLLAEGESFSLPELYERWHRAEDGRTFRQWILMIFARHFGPQPVDPRDLSYPVESRRRFGGALAPLDSELKPHKSTAANHERASMERLLRTGGPFDPARFDLSPSSVTSVGVGPEFLSQAAARLFPRGGSDLQTIEVSLLSEFDSALEHLQAQRGATAKRQALEDLLAKRFDLKDSDGGVAGPLLQALALRYVRDPWLNKAVAEPWRAALGHLKVAAATPWHALAVKMRLALEILSDENPDRPLVLPKLSETVVLATYPVRMNAPESHVRERKTSYEWNRRRQQVDINLRFGVARTVAAFLNGDGGELWLGVDDAGEAIGLDEEMENLQKPGSKDHFELRLRQQLQNQLRPSCAGYVQLKWLKIKNKSVALLEVKPRPETITYLVYNDPKTGQKREDVWIRDGNRSVSLQGMDRDEFVQKRRPK